MAPLLIAGLVGLTLVIVARSVRGAVSDRHSLEGHHRALDTLGDVAHHQDGAIPLAAEVPGARAHVRIVGTGDVPPPPPPPRVSRRRGRPPSPLIPPPPVSRSGRTVRPVSPPSRSRLPEGAPADPVGRALPAESETELVPNPAPAAGPASPYPAVEDGPDWADDLASPYPPAEVEPARIEPGAAPGPGWQTTDGRSAADGVAQPPGEGSVDTAPVPVTPVDPRFQPAPPEPASSLVLGSTEAPARRVASSGSRPAHRRRRRYRLARTAAATGVLLVVLALGLAALGQKGRQPRPTAALLSPPTTASAPPSTPPTTTTSAVLVSSDTQGARYSLLGAAVIDLVASSPCWVEIRAGSASGKLVYQGLLNPGVHHPVPADSPVWLRLGNPPAVTVVVNGTPLQPPAHATSQPYNLSFQRATTG